MLNLIDYTNLNKPIIAINFMSKYKQIVEKIYNVRRFSTSKHNLKQLKKILNHLGNPERKLKCICITGTNGKGSCAAFLESILRHNKKKTGLFISPHLYSFRERFQVNRNWISKEKLISIWNKIKHIPASYNEYITAIAIKHFCDMDVDYAIMEAGMGAKLDGINVLNPIVSIITSIAFDHQNVLGNSLIEIARDKLHIQRTEKPLIITEQVNDIIKDEKIYANKIVVSKCEYNLSLKGDFQKTNATCAVEASRILGVDENTIKKALLNTKWDGRMQLDKNGKRILYDIAHNPQATKAISKELNSIKYNNLYVVFASKKGKSYKKMIMDLVPFKKIIFTEYHNAPFSNKLNEYEDLEIEKELIKEPKNALKHAINLANENDLILVTGSLFLVSEILNKENKI